MANYLLRPEVAGGLGEQTVMDRSVHPPAVSVLDYEFEDWSGDDLVASFPCLIVTERLRDALQSSGLTGFRFVDVRISTTLNFDEFNTGALPPFYWLQVYGSRDTDDMWIGERGRLIVNDQAMSLLREFAIENCLIEEVD